MIVSKELKSDILLGSDCMTTHRLSEAPFSDNLWYITLGFIDSPLTQVKAIITDKNSQEGRILCPGSPLGTLEFLEKKGSWVSRN